MKDGQLNVALIQTDIVWEDYQANIDNVDVKINQIPDVDLIILPEMFATGFTMNTTKNSQTMDGPIVEWLREKSISVDADIVGSVIIEEDGNYYNRLIWVKPDERLYVYDKKHLFTYASEHKYFTAGKNFLIVNVNGWRIAALVCFDLRFPVWSRNIDGQYDAALYIASWPEARRNHWMTLLQARAIENQSYVIGLNRVGTDGNGITYSGDSSIIDPLGNIISKSSYKESNAIYQIERKEVLETRERFPFLKEADAFSLIADYH